MDVSLSNDNGAAFVEFRELRSKNANVESGTRRTRGTFNRLPDASGCPKGVLL